MKVSNFVWLLLVIIVIAIVSLFYTASDNDESILETVDIAENQIVNGDADASLEVSADTDVSIDSVFEDAEYPSIAFNNSFEHTKPGEYSEIIVDVSNLEPGEFSIMYVRKAGTQDYIEAGGQEHTVDSDGNIKTRFYITEFGEYEVTFSYKGKEIVSPVIVVN